MPARTQNLLGLLQVLEETVCDCKQNHTLETLYKQVVILNDQPNLLLLPHSYYYHTVNKVINMQIASSCS